MEEEYLERVLIISIQYNRLPVVKYLLEETELEKYTQLEYESQNKDRPFVKTLEEIYEIARKHKSLELLRYITKKLNENYKDILTQNTHAQESRWEKNNKDLNLLLVDNKKETVKDKGIKNGGSKNYIRIYRF